MLYRSLLDPTPTADADLDTAAMAATAAVVARGESDIQVLGELTELGMKLARSLGALAEARIEAAMKEDRALTPAEDATITAFGKMAQTVRRTVALRDKLDAPVRTRRDILVAERAGRRAELDTAHQGAKTEAVLAGLHDAYAGSTSDEECAEQVERLMEDAEEYLGEADEMRGWLDRPVGETVARLCAALGLDPDACTLDGETWKVRRPPTELEGLAAERAQKFKEPPLAPFPSPSGEGPDAQHPGWGSVMKPHTVDDCVTRPHPDGSAVCPSP